MSASNLRMLDIPHMNPEFINNDKGKIILKHKFLITKSMNTPYSRLEKGHPGEIKIHHRPHSKKPQKIKSYTKRCDMVCIWVS